MSEEKMIDAVQRALEHTGIDDELIAAGQFNPRGHSGGAWLGASRRRRGRQYRPAEMGEAAGLAVGSLAGEHAAGAVRAFPHSC